MARPGPSTSATASSGRTGPFTAEDVAFTYNYIVDDQRWAPFRASRLLIKNAVAVNDSTVVILPATPRPPDHHLDADPASARLEQGEPGGRHLVSDTPPIIGRRPFQTVEVEEGRPPGVARQSEPSGGQRPTIDEILFVTYQNPDTIGPRPSQPQPRRGLRHPTAQFPKLESNSAVQAISHDLLTWSTTPRP